MHSHINGLGTPGEDNSGLVGLYNQKEGFRMILAISSSNQGKIVVLKGPSNSGKSALIYAAEREMKKEALPTVTVSASEVVSSTASKTDTLTQLFRQATGIQVSISNKLLEGEVVDIQIERETGTKGKLILKTKDTEGVFTLSEKMIKSFYLENIAVGDVIQINKTTAFVKKLGRTRDSDTHSLIPPPEGELLKVKEEQNTVTLHDIDLINSKSLVNGGISTEVRELVDSHLREWIEEGKGRMVTGILFIKDAHLLDLECYSYLNTMSENRSFPMVVLSYSSSHSPPADFLSRSMQITTAPYTKSDLIKIIKCRADEEDLKINDSRIELLSELSQEHGLWYICSLISVLDVMSSRMGREVDELMISFAIKIFNKEE
jgi:RuvB-like protein 2